MEKNQKKLTIISLTILATFIVTILIFSNLTTDVSDVLAALEKNKAQSKTLNPDFEDSDIPPYLPDNPEAVAAFWQIDTGSFKKGEYIGIAAIKEDKIYINVKHSNLKAILTNPYRPIETEIEGATPPYKPGTTAHLESIAKESWRWQYTSEYKE